MMPNCLTNRSPVIVGYIAFAVSQALITHRADADTNAMFVLKEIIVTAERRENNLQDTPIAVSAFSQQMLDDIGVLNVQDLALSVPTLEITRESQANVTISLRGIGTSNFTEVEDPSVSFNIDGIYTARPTGAIALMHDVERVEVLRGPQGTLYGRNSNAGAINVISQKPNTKEVEGSFGLVAGDYSHMGARGVLNLPLSENFAFRVAALKEERDGFIEAGPNTPVPVDDDEGGASLDETAVRLSTLWTPTDSFSWRLTYDYNDSGSLTYMAVPASAPDIWKPDLNGASKLSVELGSFRSRFDWDINENVGLSYLASYNTNDKDQDLANPLGTPQVVSADDNRSSTHELQLKSLNTEKLDWIVGLFYFEEESETFIKFSPSPTFGLYIENPDTQIEARAVFGQATYHLNEKFRLTLGARYSEDEKERNGGGMFFCPGGVSPLANCTIQNSDNTNEGDWSKPTYRLQADWNITTNNMLYASVATGYKSGGFGDGNSPVYDEETLLTYEIGSKNEWLDRRLRLNAAFFYSDYDNLQVSTFEPIPAGGTVIVTRNAAQASILGLEIEYTWLVTDNNRLSGFFSWLDAEFDDYPNAVDPIFSPGIPINASGNNLQNAPEYSFNVIYEYSLDLPGGSVVRPRVSIAWKDDYFVRPINHPQDKQEAEAFLDASIKYSSADRNWSLEAYGRNLTDEEAFTGAFAVAAIPEPWYHYRAPLHWGVRFDYLF